MLPQKINNQKMIYLLNNNMIIRVQIINYKINNSNKNTCKNRNKLILIIIIIRIMNLSLQRLNVLIEIGDNFENFKL